MYFWAHRWRGQWPVESEFLWSSLFPGESNAILAIFDSSQARIYSSRHVLRPLGVGRGDYFANQKMKLTTSSDHAAVVQQTSMRADSVLGGFWTCDLNPVE